MIHLKIKDSSGTTHELKGKYDGSIIEWCEDLWIDLSYSCRAGACSVCAAKVISGAEHLYQNKIGEKLIELDDENWFLTCIGGFKQEALDSEDFKLIEVEMIN